LAGGRMRVLYGSNTGLASIVPGGGELGGHLNRVVAVPAVDQEEAADLLLRLGERSLRSRHPRPGPAPTWPSRWAAVARCRQIEEVMIRFKYDAPRSGDRLVVGPCLKKVKRPFRASWRGSEGG
jgi:hypothetical protein